MSNIGYYNQGRVLKEGQSYYFKYLKDIILEDQLQYMVFEDQYGVRHFVESQHYKHYNLILEGTIKCYIDKINCTGRIFLEPEHPVYKRGEAYKFGIKTVVNTEEGLVCSVADCYGNILNLPVNFHLIEDQTMPQYIVARIIRVKKGIPELEEV